MNASDQLLLHLPPVPTENQGGTGLNMTDRLPLELLEQIFTLACTDGGLTGCRLSLVSKSVREGVRSSRYHSVALSSWSTEQIARFLHAFTTDRASSAAAASAQPRVRHLFLASASLRWRRNLDQVRESDERLRREFQRDVSTLISLVAPDLLSLLVLSGHRPPNQELMLPPIGLSAYPQLQKLTIIGNGLHFAPTDAAPRSDTDPATFPPLSRLTHLHIMFNTGSFTSHTGSALNLTRWAERAPHVTHVRISRLPRGTTTDVVGQIKIIGGTDVPPIFPRLKTFIVQPDGQPPSTGCGNPRLRYKWFVQHLQKLHREATRRWALVHGSEKRQSLRDPAGFKKFARQEWKDWADGRPGCWAVDKACLVSVPAEAGAA